MTVREKLEAYYASKGLGSPDGWFALVVFGKRVRLFPLRPLAVRTRDWSPLFERRI